METKYLEFNKSCNVDSAIVGEIIEYTFTLINNVSFDLINFIIIDRLSEELEFVIGSVKIDGMTAPVSTPILGIDLGSIKAYEEKEVKFEAKVLNLSNKNTISNKAYCIYGVMDNNDILLYKEAWSNNVDLKVERVNLHIEKYSNKNQLRLGEDIQFTICLYNKGSVKCEGIILKDEISPVLEYINNSFKLENYSINSVELSKGIYLGSLNPGEKVQVQYKARLKSIYCEGKINNYAQGFFKYRTSLKYPLKDASTEIAFVEIESISANFKEFLVENTYLLNESNPDIIDFNSITEDIKILKYYVVDTLKGISSSGMRITGKKLIFISEVTYSIEYTTNNSRNTVHFDTFKDRVSNFIILPEEFNENCSLILEATSCNVSSEIKSKRDVYISTLVYVNVKILGEI